MESFFFFFSFFVMDSEVDFLSEVITGVDLLSVFVVFELFQ